MAIWPLALALSQVMGLMLFAMGILLILVGLMIIVIREIVKAFIKGLVVKTKDKIEAEDVGPWDFLLKLLEEIFGIIKELPEPLRVAFLLIIMGVIISALGYSMAIGYWPPIS